MSSQRVIKKEHQPKRDLSKESESRGEDVGKEKTARRIDKQNMSLKSVKKKFGAKNFF